MAINAEVKKLAESKPVYALAGAGAIAVEKLRELPEQIQSRGSEVQVKAKQYASTVQNKAEELAKDLPGKAREYASTVQTKAEAAAKDLPEKALGYAETLGTKAGELYDEFAARGRSIVSKVTGEAALELEEISESAKPTVKAPATTTAKKPRATRTPATKAPATKA